MIHEGGGLCLTHAFKKIEQIFARLCSQVVSFRAWRLAHEKLRCLKRGEGMERNEFRVRAGVIRFSNSSHSTEHGPSRAEAVLHD